MSFQKYAEYKDSGIEWLGEVPEHWEVKKLKHIVTKPLMYGANEAAIDDDRDQPRFVRITDIRNNGTLREDTFRSLSWHLAKPYMLREGDVLLARSGTVGKSFIYSSDWGECCFAGYLIKASIDISKASPYWFYRYTECDYYRNWISSTLIQATIQNVSAEKYNNFFLCIPPKQEQERIIAYLDKETTKIDTLIDKQEQLIALLREKREAIISHAVTRGLNPNVNMKDSGVEWLGEVPDHWIVKKLGYIATKIGSGKTPRGGSKVYLEEGILFLRSQNVHDTGLILKRLV